MIKAIKKFKKKVSLQTAGILAILIFLFFLLIIQIIASPKTSLPPTSIQQIQPSPVTTLMITPTPTIYTPQVWGHQIRVPILMYHYIGNNPDPKDSQRETISLGPDKFDEQMKYLHDNNYTSITLDTLYPTITNQTYLSEKSVILTFDDGYMDFYYNAYPILQKYNIRATVFIPTILMNQGYYLTWQQIKEMSSSGLITLGSHCFHHYHLTTLSPEAIEFELKESKKILQDTLGVPINFLAYPYGSTNNQIIEGVKKAGYIGAVGTWPSKIQSEGTIFNMPRLRISGGITLQDFIQLL